jgi:pyridinium-3,5-bisthiocarboxylic acid mononucleotide nickel chelatase
MDMAQHALQYVSFRVGPVNKKMFILRAPSGISGDMIVTGLARLAGLDNNALQTIIAEIGIPELANSLELREIKLAGISGWNGIVKLPSEHHHRTFDDIKIIITNSKLASHAKDIALNTFEMLAQAEGKVHMIAPEKVTFHEVGALDSILDICMAASLYEILEISEFYCSPLPVCDGMVECAHGLLSTPAPAVLILLENVPVYGIDSEGETITPTAIALLKAFKAKFRSWPAVVIEKTCRVYGGKVLPNIPNGAIFAIGHTYTD